MGRFPAFLLALAPLSAQAVVDTTSTYDPGAPDAQWSWVGSMSGASAVAVGARTVLTARHVTAGTFYLNGRSYAVESTALAPKINGTKVDLRVVHLQETLPGWYTMGTAATKKSEITMVGYGSGGVVKTNGSGYNVWSGNARRAGRNIITDRKTVKDRGPALTSLLDGAGEAVIAGGDSGGGWFAGDQLVGISSYIYTKDKRKADYGWAKKAYFGSGAVDLTNTKVRTWVLNQAASARSFGGPQAVPEPSTYAAFGVGALLLLRRRKRK